METKDTPYQAQCRAFNTFVLSVLEEDFAPIAPDIVEPELKTFREFVVKPDGSVSNTNMVAEKMWPMFNSRRSDIGEKTTTLLESKSPATSSGDLMLDIARGIWSRASATQKDDIWTTMANILIALDQIHDLRPFEQEKKK